MAYTSFLNTITTTYDLEKQIISTLRVFNTRSMILFYIIGLKLSNTTIFQFDTLIIILIFIATYGYASLTNFSEDILIDNENKKKNPLSQSSSLNLFRWISYACIGLSVILSLFSYHKALIVVSTLFLLILGHVYSKPPFKLSYHPLGKLLCMGLVYAYIPAFLGLFIGNLTNTTTWIMFLLCTLYVSWLPYSDIRDIGGDKKYGKKTLAVQFGVRPVAILSFILSIVCGIALVPYILLMTNYAYVFFFLYSIVCIMQIYFVIHPDAVQRKDLQVIGGYIVLGILLCFIFL